jgi:hypothetical protein
MITMRGLVDLANDLADGQGIDGGNAFLIDPF